ncbi:MAG TPA: type II secretion system protein [Gaiellaceae bacterium]|nr:type II secretion system protein [Gaiellaceae bacterium]
MGSSSRARLSRRARARAAAEDGFTLTELIVVMAILLIVVTTLSSVLVSATHTEVDANKRFQAQEQARTGLAQLTRELHCAGQTSGNSITDTSGNALTPGTAYSAVTMQLSSGCPTSGGQAVYVTWCTAASTLTTGDFALYRVTSTALPRPTCSTAGKVKWMDYLQPTAGSNPTWSTPFCLPSTTAACGGVLKPATSLPILHVTFPVNVNGPSSTIDTYNVVDDIALRNGARS